ncbi:hypothetical protein MMC25_006817 [Agyrium rufum]|nr:hypothetical protein [Agyrium rufum]
MDQSQDIDGRAITLREIFPHPEYATDLLASGKTYLELREIEDDHLPGFTQPLALVMAKLCQMSFAVWNSQHSCDLDKAIQLLEIGQLYKFSHVTGRVVQGSREDIDAVHREAERYWVPDVEEILKPRMGQEAVLLSALWWVKQKQYEGSFVLRPGGQRGVEGTTTTLEEGNASQELSFARHVGNEDRARSYQNRTTDRRERDDDVRDNLRGIRTLILIHFEQSFKARALESDKIMLDAINNTANILRLSFDLPIMSHGFGDLMHVFAESKGLLDFWARVIKTWRFWQDERKFVDERSAKEAFDSDRWRTEDLRRIKEMYQRELEPLTVDLEVREELRGEADRSAEGGHKDDYTELFAKFIVPIATEVRRETVRKMMEEEKAEKE